jgi:peptide deformylase
MALLPIRIFGDPILRERAAEVTGFDVALRRLADDMLATMRAARGAGLAANQVGVLKRLFTWEVADERHGAYANPEVLEVSEEIQEGEEGCLSFPGLFYPTIRPLRARLRVRDVTGDEHEIEGEGLLARIFLHEIDHLNGVLFIDHISKLKRDRITKKFAKAAKREAEGDD